MRKCTSRGSSQWLAKEGSSASAEKKLLPASPAALAADLHLLGVILAASEKAVQRVYELNLRPAERQHQPWIDRVSGQLLAACNLWQQALRERPLTGDQPDQVAITSAVVWRFIQLMLPAFVSADDFSLIARHADHMEALPVFRQYPQQ